MSVYICTYCGAECSPTGVIEDTLVQAACSDEICRAIQWKPILPLDCSKDFSYITSPEGKILRERAIAKALEAK